VTVAPVEASIYDPQGPEDDAASPADENLQQALAAYSDDPTYEKLRSLSPSK
jgi:hypothetical protein